MMGFYKNFLTKNKAVGVVQPSATVGQEEVTAAPTVQKTGREKIEEKLAELKAKQERQAQIERDRKQDPDYDDDPFSVKMKTKV